jgi:3-oxoacyl-[acyl-carrier protein] reductase
MHNNRVVVLTGAAGGIGSLIAARFLANGDKVIATDTNDEELTSLTRRLHQPANLYTASADISDQASCSRLAEFATEKAQRVDVLVNCAGYFPTQSFDDMTLADWNKVIGINLTGVFLMTKAMLPLMKGRDWGRIINIGSASMFEGVAQQIHYVAAKAGVVGFSRSLARAVGSGGITVNVVTPGLTLTPKAKEALPKELIDQQIQTRAIPRDEKGEDLVGAVFFLASPDADFISGQTINVDGGKHML